MKFSIALLPVAGAFPAFMTFNDYSTQSSVACGTNPGDNPSLDLYMAAASDNSADLFQGGCNYSSQDTAMDMSQCSAVQAGTYHGPACHNGLCGHCFNVTNSPSPGAGGPSIVVKIIDACPKYHAANYCKTDALGYTAEDRCAADDDHLDVSINARQAIGAPSVRLSKMRMVSPAADNR